MYNDMYKTYKDEKFTYNYPINFESRNMPYLEMQDKALAEWTSRQDKQFKIKCSYELKTGEYFYIQFYNYRYEYVTDDFSETVENGVIVFDINDVMEELLYPDVYYITLCVQTDYGKVEDICKLEDEYFIHIK